MTKQAKQKPNQDRTRTRPLTIEDLSKVVGGIPKQPDPGNNK